MRVKLTKRRHLTAEIAAEIKRLAATTDLFQDEIAAIVRQNPGRVSEILSGKRFSDVPPAQ
jgi:hypothetical protein